MTFILLVIGLLLMKVVYDLYHPEEIKTTFITEEEFSKLSSRGQTIVALGMSYGFYIIKDLKKIKYQEREAWINYNLARVAKLIEISPSCDEHRLEYLGFAELQKEHWRDI